MKKSFLHAVIVSCSLLLLSRLEAGAPPEAAKPFNVAVNSIVSALKRLGDDPSGLSSPEEIEFKKLIKSGGTALATLSHRIGSQDVPEDYLNDLTTAGAVLDRIGATSTLTTEALVQLRAIVKDIEAKRRWAEKNRETPAGPVALEVAAKKTKQAVDGLEVWFCNAIDEQRPPVQGGALGANDGRIWLPPGNYFLWLRTHGATPHDGAKHEFAVDGAPSRIELAPPTDAESGKRNPRSAKEKMN